MSMNAPGCQAAVSHSVGVTYARALLLLLLLMRYLGNVHQFASTKTRTRSL